VNVTAKLISVSFELNKSTDRINGLSLFWVTSALTQPAVQRTGNTPDVIRRYLVLFQLALGRGVRVFPDFPHVNATTERIRESAPPPLIIFPIHQKTTTIQNACIQSQFITPWLITQCIITTIRMWHLRCS
jgi:hypothetical protein